jgi:stage V sporulation protein D (sporulation-specific penicillin-binding protein)
VTPLLFPINFSGSYEVFMERNLTYHRRKRTIMFFGVFLCGIILCGRLVYLMVFRSEYYTTLATDLQQRERSIKAARGKILDRNNIVLASNKSVCTVSVIHNQITDPEAVIAMLVNELGLSEERVRKRVEKYSSIEKIAGNVEKEIGDRILSYGYSGVKVDEDYRRTYPYEDLASKVLGFTGGDNQGILGLEVMYDDDLSGTNGTILTYTDARGVEVENAAEERIEPVNGNHLLTTLDYNIQMYCTQAAEKAYLQKDADGVEIIVMNPQDGEIYAMVDYPEYNLNDPFTLNGEYQQYAGTEEENTYQNKMWRNWCVSDTYEPGSIFKTVTTAASLEEQTVALNEQFYCPGYIVVEDRRIRCHKTAGHGSEDFRQALGNSCNPVFITLGLRLGAERYYNYMKQFGLFRKTGIDLPGEAATIMHSLDAIGEVELATMSFGQSFQVTPIQMATTVSSLVNGGHRVTPHLGKAIVDDDGNVIKEFTYEQGEAICSEETSATMRELLQYVVEEGGGSKAYIEGYEIGGKTATSQTLPRSEQKYIASFIGFSPASDPNVLVMVIIRNPSGVYYGGTIAAPVAREIFENILPYLE